MCGGSVGLCGAVVNQRYIFRLKESLKGVVSLYGPCNAVFPAVVVGRGLVLIFNEV